MAPPQKVITNVLVGRANMYIAEEGIAGPPDTLPFNEEWGNPWYHPGYSDSGLAFGIDRKEKKHYVDDISSPAVITVEESTLMVTFTFAEATLENLRYAAGGGTVTKTAPAIDQIGKTELVLSEELEVLSLGFEGKNPQGFFRRVVIPRVVSIGKINVQFDRASNKQVYAAQFETVCPVSEIEIYDKTANATS